MSEPDMGQPPAIKTDVEGRLGPWFLGFVALTFMMGVLASQVTKYFSTFGYESMRLCLLVVFCIILSVAQWIVIMTAEWGWFVANYGDWQRLAPVPWQSPAFMSITWFTIFTAQLFFASRCYTLYGRNKLIFGALLLGMTVYLGFFVFLAALIATDPFHFPMLYKISTCGLSINVATDVAITGLTLWKIRRGNDMYSPKTQHGLRRLRNQIVEAAVPPTICVILSIGTFIGTIQKNLVSQWFIMVSSTVYVLSMMFTLNSRPTIRQTFDAPTSNEAKTLSTGFQFARVQVSACQHEQRDIEKATIALAMIPEPIYPLGTAMNLNQERVIRHPTAETARRSKEDINSEIV